MFKIVTEKDGGKKVVLFSFMRWSVRYSCKRRLRKTKFIVLTGPRDRRHSKPHRTTWQNTRVAGGRGQEQGWCLSHSFIGISAGKAWQGKQLKIDQFEYFQWSLGS